MWFTVLARNYKYNYLYFTGQLVIYFNLDFGSCKRYQNILIALILTIKQSFYFDA